MCEKENKARAFLLEDMNFFFFLLFGPCNRVNNADNILWLVLSQCCSGSRSRAAVNITQRGKVAGAPGQEQNRTAHHRQPHVGFEADSKS